MVFIVIGIGEKRHQPSAATKKAAGIGFVYNGAAGPYIALFIPFDGDGQFLPMEEIPADRMAPVHRPETVVEGVILIKQMVFPLHID